MKTTRFRFSTPSAFVVAALGATLFSASALAQVINPDPDIFDGTKTKTQAIKQDQQPASKSDDWEGDNLIVYDSNEQGSAQGGLGRSGYDKPGMDIGVDAGVSSGLGIPIPLGGGAAGGGAQPPGLPSLNVPLGGESGAAGQQPNMSITPPGVSAGGASADAQGGGDASTEGLSAQSAVAPGDVPIGDSDQKIKGSTVAGRGDADQAPSEEGGKGSQSTQDGGQSANVGGAGGGGQQGGRRGTGVEKGDAMPSDL